MLRPYMRTMHAVPNPEQNIRVSDVWLAEHATPAVAGALGLRARSSLEVVHEPSDGAAFDEPSGPRTDAFVVYPPRGRPPRRDRVVDDRQPLVAPHGSDLTAERGASPKHRVPPTPRR